MSTENNISRIGNFSMMLVPDGGGHVRHIHIGRYSIYTIGVLLLSCLMFGGWGAWYIFHDYRAGQKILHLQSQMDASQVQEQQEVIHLKKHIHDEENMHHQKIAVMVRHIGSLQARLARLDALGARLVETASLDAAEFNFSAPPAVGGPRMVSSLAVSTVNSGNALRLIDSKLSNMNAQLQAIDYLLQQKRDEKAARPHGWPSEGGWFSSAYGLRTDPFTGEQARHQGVDIANRFGAPVLSASRGIVSFAGKMKDFGYMVDVDHGYGYVTRYGHMSAIAVHVGDLVEDNQVIGRIGSTGRSTGPHLHYEVHRYGRFMDPAVFLPRKG